MGIIIVETTVEYLNMILNAELNIFDNDDSLQLLDRCFSHDQRELVFSIIDFESRFQWSTTQPPKFFRLQMTFRSRE